MLEGVSDALTLKIFRGDDDPALLQTVLTLREAVFVVEQHVPYDEEVDGLDGAAEHVAILRDEVAVGTARLRLVNGVAKIERVAVDGSLRGFGLGRRVMEAIEDLARHREQPVALLAAQLPVLPFYSKLGYTAEGDVFLDAGIEHRWMRKTL